MGRCPKNPKIKQTSYMWMALRVNLIRPEPSGGKKFIMLDPKFTSDASYVEKRHRPFGRCYMIHPEHWIRELGISSIEVA